MSHNPRRFRRLAVVASAIASTAMLCSCSSDGNNNWGAMIDVARQAWEQSDGDVQLKQAASIPYATLGYRFSGSSEQMLILATDDGNERLWTSAARIAIRERHGRIVSTAGFDRNLAGYNAVDPGIPNWREPGRYSWLADYPDIGLYSVRVDCEDLPSGPEKIVILGKEIDTLRVNKSCSSSQLGWQFSNVYWVSLSSNRVWKSIQHLHPKLDPLEIELLRPPESPN